ncbi:hypothetical protein [Angelakisella massiliensis]|uniref:hypothetical protein n=1 Tax=Angelakisella massiliensis TaxID=1871018 RepID=UPI0024B0FCFA|nr:hypothetical protein [Angelakisella massiliensis]
MKKRRQCVGCAPLPLGNIWAFKNKHRKIKRLFLHSVRQLDFLLSQKRKVELLMAFQAQRTQKSFAHIRFFSAIHRLFPCRAGTYFRTVLPAKESQDKIDILHRL